MGRTLPLNAVVPAAVPRPGQIAPQFRTQLGLQPMPAPPMPVAPFADRNVPASISDPSLPADAFGDSTSRPTQPPHGWGSAGAPSPYGATHQAAPFAPVPNFGPGGGSFAFPPTPYPGPAVTEQPAVAMPPAARASRMRATMLTTRSKRVPVWAVAFASCLIALVMAGGVILIYAVFHAPPKPSPQARSTGTGKSSGAKLSEVVSAPSPGLFKAARAGFLAAATPPPPTADTPANAAPPGTATAGAPPPAPTDTGGTAAAPPPAATPPAQTAATSQPAAASPPPPSPAPAPVAPPTSQPTPVAQPTPTPVPRNTTPAAPSTGTGG